MVFNNSTSYGALFT